MGIRSEIQAFDKAVKVAKEFADKDMNTVIIIATDHGTGGLTVGHRQITSVYDKAPLSSFTHIIKDAKLTGAGFAKKLNEERTNIAAVAKEAYGFDMNEAEIKKLKKLRTFKKQLAKWYQIDLTSVGLLVDT